VHHPHAAQPGRGHPAGEVGGGAATEPDDRIRAGEAGRAERVPAVAGHRKGLGRLAVRHRQRQHPQPGRAQRLGHRRGPVGQRGRVHQRDLGGAGQQPGQLAVQPVADHHLVRRRAADRDPGAHAGSDAAPAGAVGLMARPRR
jgi:hypothetical protein